MLQQGGVRDKSLIIAALLHDSVEDTGMFGSPAVPGQDPREVAMFRLDRTFGPEVSSMVLAVSKTGGEKNEDYLARIRGAGPGAILIKLADRLHNMSTLLGTSREKQHRKIAETTKHYLPMFEVLAGKPGPCRRPATKLLPLLETEIALIRERSMRD